MELVPVDPELLWDVREDGDFQEDGITLDSDSDSDWDTDLEELAKVTPASVPLNNVYLEACEKFHVPPVTKFIKQMNTNAVNLKHYGVLDNGAQAIAMTLSENVTIATLNLHDNGIKDKGGVSIGKMMKQNCFIVSLDLSGNIIGGKGTRAIAKMLLENVTLKELNLSENKLIDEDISLLCETLKKNFHLKNLNLSGNDLGTHAGTMLGSTLSANNVLEHLDLSWNRILGRGAINLAMGVKESWSLKELKLAWNGFGDLGAHALRGVLEETDNLSYLDISSASIGLDGVAHIGKGLKLNKNLKVLKVGKNPFLSAGASILLKAALQNNDSALEELHLENIVFDKECEKVLDEVLKRKPNFSCTWDIVIEGGNAVLAINEPETSPLDKFVQFVRNKGLRMVDLYRTLTRSDSLRESEFVKGLKGLNAQMSDRELRDLYHLLDENDDKELQFSEFTSILNLRIRERDAQKKRKQTRKI